jgi:CDP-diglyceride synthetase
MIDGKNLAKRVSFAAVAVPAGWWVINSDLSLITTSFGRVIPGQLTTLALILLGGFEYNRMLGSFFPKNAFWLGLLWLLSQLLFDLFHFAMPMKHSIFILLIIVAIEAIVWGEKNTGRWKRASLLFSATVFLYIAGSSLLNLYQEPFQSFFMSFPQEMLSQIGIASVFITVFMCDTAAYFVGSLWGRHHFSTVSPNKTIEGCIAGFVTALVVCTVLWLFLGNPQYPRSTGLFMGLILGIFAQIGDLMVSLMKRYFRVKNASEMIPGHGGVLDRFGSVFVAVPTLGLFIWFINRILG